MNSLCVTCIHQTVCKKNDGVSADTIICKDYADEKLYLKLPCPINTQVWVVSKNCTEPYPAKFKCDDIPHLNKRVFLKKADAMWKMRLMKNESKNTN